MKIPYELITNTYDDFPFKSEIIESLITLRDIQDAIKISHYYFSSVLLAIQLLINVNIDRNHLDHHFPQYKDLKLYIERYEGWYDYIYSLPDQMGYDSANLWSKEDLDFYQKVNFTKLSFRNLSKFNKELLNSLRQWKHKSVATYLLTYIFISESQYIWSYNMVNTRSFGIEFSWYQKLSNRTLSSSELSLIHKYFTVDGSILLPVADFANHLPSSSITPFRFLFSFISSNLLLSSTGFYLPGSEYGFANTTQASSTHLISSYGFTTEDNSLEEIKIFVKNRFTGRKEMQKEKELWLKMEWVEKGKGGALDRNDNIWYGLRRTGYSVHLMQYFRVGKKGWEKDVWELGVYQEVAAMMEYAEVIEGVMRKDKGKRLKVCSLMHCRYTDWRSVRSTKRL